jgi:hypothetical protein
MSVWQSCKKWLGLGGAPARQLGNGLREDNERLRQRVQELDAQRDRERQSLAALREEYAAYRRLLPESARDQFSADERRRFGQDEDESQCRSLDEFIGELEASVRDRKHT